MTIHGTGTGKGKHKWIKQNTKLLHNVPSKVSNHSPFGKQVLKMDHLHHDGHVLLRSGAEIVFNIALSLELEDHLFNGHTLPADAAELVP